MAISRPSVFVTTSIARAAWDRFGSASRRLLMSVLIMSHLCAGRRSRIGYPFVSSRNQDRDSTPMIDGRVVTLTRASGPRPFSLMTEIPRVYVVSGRSRAIVSIIVFG